jgi:ribose 5-phosphate isomerase B
MKIAVGADHAGFLLKEQLIPFLRELGHVVRDCGTFSEESVDYPDQAEAVARLVADGTVERGILLCGTGLGMAISANKIAGIRATTCNDLFSAKMARAHNDANVLTLGGRMIGQELAEEIVRTFLTTVWAGNHERHTRRIAKIHALEGCADAKDR